jgi:DNA-binding transcriptional LysR family regulator
VASMRHEVSGRVRLGCIGTASRWLLPHLLRAVAERHPHIHVVIVDATTTSLVPQVVSGALDLAVVNLPLANVDIVTEPLFDEQRILAAPFAHPLANRAHVELADLADHELLLEPRGTPFRDELDQEASRVGVDMRPQAEIDGVGLLAWLAFRGYGAAILPATAASGWIESSCRLIAVRGLTPRSVGIAVLRRGRPSAPARAVRAAIRELVQATDQEGVHPTLAAEGGADPS